ncbi:hypothetical protein ACSSVQ_000111 [Parvibaculum sp. MBR-TMA-1.3b-4.2]
MPFYLRKSVRAGPFRFNFSKSGVGVSVGVKGLRVGTGPRGHYVHAGRNGFYYRASARRAGSSPASSKTESQIDRKHMVFDVEGVEMTEIDSGDVLAMRDESFDELLDEINAKRDQFSMAVLLGLAGAVIGGTIAPAIGPEALWLVALALPGALIGHWLDTYRRTAVLFYDLEQDMEALYRAVTESFDALSQCGGKWHVEAGGAVRDLTTWKRNAGATHIVRKKRTALSYRLPNVVKSNVTPPALQVGKQVIYFLPDTALVDDGRHLGAVGYSDLRIKLEESDFIEEGGVPHDAIVVRHTWKHPNKRGGPDRRYKDNYQIPVCRYEMMHLTSKSGLNELVEFSKLGVAINFVDAIREMPKNVCLKSLQEKA